ncbi:MAG TPA: M48 family metallopeptidase [bacterium]|nr:M48 family metallopeptidase [bacterium]
MDTIKVEPWPMEKPLLWLVGVFSFFVWFALCISVFGIVYIGLIGVVLFVGHVVFIAHVKGSGVKLGPDQFPDLHQSVERLARRMGFDAVPDAYVVQAGGLLNAMATKLFKSNVIILYSDLLEACGEDTAARDMIVAHELGHIKEGHLKYLWFLLPGLFVPFLGSALSRAREYTCDRYGLAGAGRTEGAMRGLTILAAGAKRGPQVNLQAMARQVEDLNSGWLTLGTWLATHPPLAARMIALEETLKPAGYDGSRGLIRALGIVGAVYVLPTLAMIIVYTFVVMAALNKQRERNFDFPSAPAYDSAPEYPGQPSNE